MWEHIRELQREGVTVLLATNYLDEADRLCNRLTIIDNGRAVVTGTPAELKRAVGADVVQVATRRAGAAARGDRGASRGCKRIVEPETGEVHVYVDDASVALPAIMQVSVEQRRRARARDVQPADARRRVPAAHGPRAARRGAGGMTADERDRHCEMPRGSGRRETMSLRSVGAGSRSR